MGQTRSRGSGQNYVLLHELDARLVLEEWLGSSCRARADWKMPMCLPFVAVEHIAPRDNGVVSYLRALILSLRDALFLPGYTLLTS